jgi:tetratricopeptide (TPR) repeat protein
MAEAEWRAGFVEDPSGQHRRLLPVRVEQCEPKGLLADRVWIDLTNLDEASARSVLREGVAAALRGHARPATRPRFPRAPQSTAVDRPRFPTALPPVWNVPFSRNPIFTGRDQALAVLADQLKHGGTTAATQVLQSGGGVGKTAIAVEYAWRYRAGFDVVWWVRAEKPATLVGDYADLAAALGLDEALQADQQFAVAAVQRWLESHDRWLLILDNAEAPTSPSGLRAPLAQVMDLLPRIVHGQVIVTSRDATWDRHASLTELEVFSMAEATAFLLARSDSTNGPVAAELAELLGLLPLALEQAGAYVHETKISLATYLERLRKFPAAALGKGPPRDRDPTDMVTTTWQVSMDRVRAIPGAVALLELCALLAPEGVPRALFDQPLEPPAEDLHALAADPFALDDAVLALRRFGLVKATAESLTVHRLLQQVVRDRLDSRAKAARAGAALRLLNAAFPSGGYDDSRLWPACASLLPHALAAAGYAAQCEVEPLEAGVLLDNAASYLRGRARYQGARALRERALTIRETHLGTDDPATARSLHHLAVVLSDLGDLDRARILHERALAIRETHLGANHPDTAESLNGLAVIAMVDQGDFESARSLHERALAIRETQLGPNHPATVQSLNNLAIVLTDQGDLADGRSLHERALAIRETQLGPNHPATANSLNGLAIVLARQGDLDTARSLHERALAIREAHLGSDHPDTAESLNNLATILACVGDFDTARTLHEHALTILEARLGSDHRDTMETRDHLAAIGAKSNEQ